MASLRQFVSRLLSIFRSDRSERELSKEIESHLALLEDEYVAKGLSPADAKLAARRSFGGVDQAKERQRDARSFRWPESVRRDVAYAFRSLWRSPAFSIAAILTLSIGVGASTAIYSVVDTILLRPLPYPDGDRLVDVIENQRPRNLFGINYSEFLEWQSRAQTLDLASVSYNPSILMATRDGMVRLAGAFVSTSYFDVYRIQPALGRTIQPSDEANLEVVVLTHDSWQRYFHSDPNVIGAPIELRSRFLSGRPFTVIGVLAPDVLANEGDFFVPAFNPPQGPLGVNRMFGRLRANVSLAAANSEAITIGSAVRPPRPADAPPLTMPRFEVASMKDRQVEPLRPALRVFLVAVAVMLLIVCANVASLLLARGTSRQKEIAVRLAIGASRGRILQQLFCECMVLALVGGLGGVLLGAAGVSLVKSLATVEAPGVFRLVFGDTILPRGAEVGVSGRLLAIAIAISAIASVFFGLLPAWLVSRTREAAAIGTRGVAATHHAGRTRSVLVVAQLVLATVLLVGAGLLANSFLKLSTVEKGYDPENVLAFQLVFPPEYATARKAATIESVLQSLRASPQVSSAGFSYAGILIGVQDTVGTFVPPGRTLAELKDDPDKPKVKAVSRGYLETVGVHLLNGRLFNEGDDAAAPLVAVVNRNVATKLFGGANPVGAEMIWHGPKVQIPLQVVGVIEDVRQGSVSRTPWPEVFVDYRQLLVIGERWGLKPPQIEGLAFGFLSFAIKTRSAPEDSIPLVRQTVNTLDRNVGIDAIIPMERLVSSSVARQRFYAVMLGIFAGVAGLLAAIGVYGVLAYAVVQRTQEIGIRMALGAERRQVLGLVLRRGLILATIGIAIGVGGAMAGAKYLQSMLFGIEPRDPMTFVTVAAAFALIAVAASYLPARRATKVDPMVALRVE